MGREGQRDRYYVAVMVLCGFRQNAHVLLAVVIRSRAVCVASVSVTEFRALWSAGLFLLLLSCYSCRLAAS